MPSLASWRTGLPLLAFVAWAGAVLVRYQGVESPEPLVALVLLCAWLLVFSLACVGVGASIRRLVFGGSSLELRAAPLVAVWGAAGLMLLGALAAAIGLLGPPMLVGILALAAVIGAVVMRNAPIGPRWHVSPRLVVPLAAVAGAIVITLPALPTAAPFYDQLHYHLAFPFHWLRSGFITTFPRHAYSFLPADMGLLYAYPLATLGPWAAQAVHWWMGAVTAVLVGQVAARLGGPRAAWWAAAVVAVTPAVVLVSTWAAADLGAAAFAAAGWAMLTTGSHQVAPTRPWAWWVLAGAMAGVAAGCKLLAVATVGIPTFCGVLLLAGPWRVRARRALLWSAGATLALAPWLARSFAATGNPLYPFFPRVFASGLSPAAAQAADTLARGVAADQGGDRDLRVITSLGTFHLGGEGVIGPLYLTLLPAVLWVAWTSRRKVHAALAVGVVLGVAGWGVGPPRARYLIPVLVPLAVLTGVAVQRLWTRAPVRTRVWLAVLLTAATGWALLSSPSSIELTRIACTLGRSSPEELMRQNVSYWPAVSFVNRNLPPDARLLMVGESRGMYLDRDLEIEDPVRRPRLVELAESSTSAADMARHLRADGVTHVLVNWQEAKRIAAYNGRTDYFEPLSAAGHDRLVGFFEVCLVRVFSERPVEVYTLESCHP